jgi:hypothetical protein|tara:strand:+ start:1 stop:894 length:894 start_codon:yes stop_codon:yes gene_type:complete
MKIQVIVTCAASKTIKVPEELQFGKLPTLPVTESVNEWINRLKSTNVGLIKMVDLYKGGYWGIVKDINSNSKVDNVWVLSAGYGIVNVNQSVKPYAIALKDNSDDSIKLNTEGQSKESYSKWWDGIISKRDLSITDVYNQHPNDIFIVYASFEYMKAIKNDFINIVDKPNVLIISPDTKIKEFVPHILNTNLRLRSFLGGNKMTVSSLTVKHLVENIDKIGYTKDEVNSYFEDIISKQPELPPMNPVRKKLNDDDFIKLLLEIGIDKSKTSIIKEVNKRGYASGVNRTTRILNKLKK